MEEEKDEKDKNQSKALDEYTCYEMIRICCPCFFIISKQK